MNKTILGLAIVGLLLLAACTAPSEDLARAQVTDDSTDDSTEETSEVAVVQGTAVTIDPFNSKLYFEGFGPGKSHVGQFDVFEGTLTFDETGNLVAASGIIDASTIATGIEGLDNHLKTDDFLNVEVYPQIVIESTNIQTVDGQTIVQADITLLGTTKNIEFPVEVTGQTVSANFVIDITDFNIKYTAISQEVRIEFNFVPVAG